MTDFAFYLKLGIEHILSVGALDHQLFVLALIAVFIFREIKQVLILITAFTIGHSLTLALSAFEIVQVPTKWIEFLIPCTIVITAFLNFFNKNKTKSGVQYNYFLALFFGMIHGLGFANGLKVMIAKGQSFVLSLLSFNIGLEIGQIVVVLFLLLLSFVSSFLFKIARKDWQLFLSSCAFALSLQMAVERFPL